MGPGGKSPRVINLGTNWKSMVSFTLRLFLYPDKDLCASTGGDHM
jgi:hypothetical protein